jgi:hypothetical protein
MVCGPVVEGVADGSVPVGEADVSIVLVREGGALVPVSEVVLSSVELVSGRGVGVGREGGGCTDCDDGGEEETGGFTWEEMKRHS